MKMPRENTQQVAAIPRSRHARTIGLPPLFLNKGTNIERNVTSPRSPHVKSRYPIVAANSRWASVSLRSPGRIIPLAFRYKAWFCSHMPNTFSIGERRPNNSKD